MRKSSRSLVAASAALVRSSQALLTLSYVHEYHTFSRLLHHVSRQVRHRLNFTRQTLIKFSRGSKASSHKNVADEIKHKTSRKSDENVREILIKKTHYLRLWKSDDFSL